MSMQREPGAGAPAMDADGLAEGAPAGGVSKPEGAAAPAGASGARLAKGASLGRAATAGDAAAQGAAVAGAVSGLGAKKGRKSGGVASAAEGTGAKAASRKFLTVSFALATVMFVALLVAIAVPGKVTPRTSVPFYVAAVLIEALFLWRYVAGGKKRSTCHIAIAMWVLLIAWEVLSTDLKLTHPVLIPNPENVFAVFPKLWDELLLNVVSSLTLLAQGFLTALAAGYLLGLFVGWIPQLRDAVYPIAHVLAPVPAIVFAPYLVMLMPSFKAAAVMVIFLGIFWPTLLDTILLVGSMDRRIIESARMLGLSTPTMIFEVMLPYMYPGIVKGLKTQLPSAMLMLVMAEMYGATSGLGYFVINYTNYANYTNVVAGIIVVGIVVTLLDGLVSLLVRKTVKWSE